MRQNKLIALVFGIVLAAVSGLILAGSSKDKKGPPIKPPTKQTQVIRAEVYKKLEIAQKAFEAKDYAGALTALDVIKAGYDKLNDYEKATIWSLYGATYYAKGDTKASINAYISELQQKNLPDGLRDSGLHTLAQLYFIVEDYPRAIAVIQKWIALSSEPPPDGYVLLAQADYQLKRYNDAEKALITALKINRDKNIPPKESALSLLRAIYYDEKQYAKSAKALEALLNLFPEKATYWQQLAGMYGLLGLQRDEMKIMHGAYQAGMMHNEGDLLNLARLYMVYNIPYPAVQVLNKELRGGAIKTTPDTLQLYAQALVMAKEYDLQVPVLKKLADMTGESQHYVFLAQAYGQVDKWPEAADAFKKALHSKNVAKQDEIQIQLGNALYNAGNLQEARQVFSAAIQMPAQSEAAANWVKFVDSEIQRKNSLKSL